MDIWDDADWPVSIRKKDDEQKLFHKSVSSAFFLMMDGNDQTLPLDVIRELCRLPEACDTPSELPHGRSERVMRDIDEEYGQMLDVIEGLKISLTFGKNHDSGNGGAAEQLIAEFAESLTAQDDDFDVPLFRLSERRGTKPS